MQNNVERERILLYVTEAIYTKSAHEVPTCLECPDEVLL